MSFFHKHFGPFDPDVDTLWFLDGSGRVRVRRGVKIEVIYTKCKNRLRPLIAAFCACKDLSRPDASGSAIKRFATIAKSTVDFDRNRRIGRCENLDKQ